MRAAILYFSEEQAYSTVSNIPDFRSADGIYHQSYKYSPEEVVTTVFMKSIRKRFLSLSGEDDGIGCKAQCRTFEAGRT